MRQAQARQKFGSQLVSRRRQRGFASQSHISGSLDTKILKKLPNHPEKLKKSLVQNPIPGLYLIKIVVKIGSADAFAKEQNISIHSDISSRRPAR
jgi:hypothetical protein